MSAAALAACGGGSSASTAVPPAQSSVSVRYVDGAPALDALINGVPTDIGAAYLQVDGSTVASSFAYGTLTSFASLSAGAHSLVARDDLGYAVGPVNTPALTGGKRYTLILVGSYPKYAVLAFEEPPFASGARLSLYEAAPSMASAKFGSFRASSHSNYVQRGSAGFGSIATASLGAKVSNLGGYVGAASNPTGQLTPAQINSFDRRNELPFHAISRLSLFLFDVKTGSSHGPVFGSLDR